MRKSALIERIQEINVWKKRGQRAPHKPLLLLLALAKCSNNDDRLIDYSFVDKELRQLLIEFGPPRKSVHPEFPFWRLQNDGLWTVTPNQNLRYRKGSSDIPKNVLLEVDAQGGFLPEIYDFLNQNKAFIPQLAQIILDDHFPESMHQDILNAVGLDRHYLTAKKAKRDPSFRDRVIRAYEHQCAICGYNLRLDKANLGLEAAHIMWHQAGGPDIETNGMALCAMHHRVFDRGAFTVSEKYKILVSQHVHGSSGIQEWLTRFHNKKIIFPQSPEFYPKKKYLNWHYREVFKSPERYCST